MHISIHNVAIQYYCIDYVNRFIHKMDVFIFNLYITVYKTKYKLFKCSSKLGYSIFVSRGVFYVVCCVLL